jgi:hypothetical protein
MADIDNLEADIRGVLAKYDSMKAAEAHAAVSNVATALHAGAQATPHPASATVAHALPPKATTHATASAPSATTATASTSSATKT